jgi:hypothetical protein
MTLLVLGLIPVPRHPSRAVATSLRAGLVANGAVQRFKGVFSLVSLWGSR